MPSEIAPPTLFAFLRANRFALLLAGLVVLFFYGAVIEFSAPQFQSLVVRIAVGTILAYLMLAAAFAVTPTGKPTRTVITLTLLTVLFEILDVTVLYDVTQFLGHTSAMLFVGYVILRLLQIIFESRRVTADTIFASLCAYLLLATFWMYGYSLLEMFDHGAFFYSQIDDPNQGIMRVGAAPAGIEFYFSIVTLTTLGYGDIVPVSPAARSMATLQAVVGQLYLAVLVARLVGLHVAESMREGR